MSDTQSFTDWDHTVIMDSSSSQCGACGKSALPSEGQHLTVPSGWGNNPVRTGCKTKWKYAATTKLYESHDWLIQGWPQFIWVGVVSGFHPDEFHLYESWLQDSKKPEKKLSLRHLFIRVSRRSKNEDEKRWRL